MAKPYYEFFCPVKVIAGHAALEHIPFELATLGATRPLIITDKGVRSNNLLAPIEAAFESTDAVIGYIFDDVPPDSSLETVRKAAQLYRDNNCDAIYKYTKTPVASQIEVTNGAEALAGSSLSKFNINGRLVPIRQPSKTMPIMLSAKTKATISPPR